MTLRDGSGGSPGFTLLEIVVVLVILGLGAALVAPALLTSDEGERPTLAAVIGHVQDMAAQRGETLLLDVFPEGHWEVLGSASLADGTLASGELAGERPNRAFTLRVAPLGSCGLTLASDSMGPPPDLDPLTCRVGSS